MMAFMVWFSIMSVFISMVFANENLEIIKKQALEYHDHETYELWYDVENRNPAYVIWDITFEDAILSEAVNNRTTSKFTVCKSSVKEIVYSKSGYDKGHMCPSNDRDWSKESSYNTFRMCNVCPQTPALNRGSWKKYEKRGHELAKKYQKVTIAAGPIYENNENVFLIKGGVRIPDAFFKVFYADGKFLEAYIFYQDGSTVTKSISDIEKVAKLQFVAKK